MRTDRHDFKISPFLILRPADSRLRRTVARNAVLFKPGEQYFNSTTIGKRN